MTWDLAKLADDARAYLTSHRWCLEVQRCDLAFAVPDLLAVFRCEIRGADPSVDAWLWVVVGDLPPAYLCNDNTSHAEALDGYVSEMGRWCRAVRKGEPLEELMKGAGTPTPAFAAAVEARLKLVRDRVLPLARNEKGVADPIRPLPGSLREAFPENWFTIREEMHLIDWLTHRERHYERFFGPADDMVMHDKSPRRPHVDVLTYRPHAEACVLVTSGMSNWPQQTPPGSFPTVAHRSELLAYAHKPTARLAALLVSLAHRPFEQGTYFHYGHTVASAVRSGATGEFCILMPALIEPPGLNEMEIDGERVHLLWVLPISESELDYARRAGGTALGHLLWEHRVPPYLDTHRPPIV